jgi:hypothetical protein
VSAARTATPIPLPATIRQGGRRDWVSAAVAGPVPGVVLLLVPALLSDQDAFGFLTVWRGCRPAWATTPWSAPTSASGSSKLVR